MEFQCSIKGPGFDIKLSAWDKRFPPMYSKRILFFQFVNTSEQNVKKLASALEKAMEATVHDLPFLAGAITSPEGTPWVYDLKPGGKVAVTVKDLRSKIDYNQLKEAGFASSLLDAEDFCDYPKLMHLDTAGLPVCALRINVLGGGGIAMVLQISHTVCDGNAVTSVTRRFVERFRQAQNGSLATSTQANVTFSEDRTKLVSGNGAHGDITKHPAWAIGPAAGTKNLDSSTFVCANYFIKQSRLEELKATARIAESKTLSSEGYVSTHDTICALLWRSLALARKNAGVISNETDTSFTTAVDCRTKLGLPEPYFGNVIDAINVKMSTTALASDSAVGKAAETIRNAVAGITAESFRDLVGFVERTSHDTSTRLADMDNLTTSAVMVISWFGFNMHELDFGPMLGGQPVACKLGHRGMFPGIAYILPLIPGKDGGCEFVLNEPAAVMSALSEDAVFNKYAQKTR